LCISSAETFGIEVTQVKAPQIGMRVPLEEVEAALKSNTFDMIALTQVDTSTAVLNDIKALSELVQRVSPSTLVAVDGVCSFGSEVFYMDDWKVDAAMTCSQKGLGRIIIQ
jgi:alanine-glyoxylate transaminase/serine-glyoxylate transaminase/serine-pyruvate transaminase